MWQTALDVSAFVSRSRDKTDFDIIKENHRFLWEDDDDDDGNGENNDTVPNSWGVKLAKKYYDKLFKEYCICDLIHYKDNKVLKVYNS